MLAGTSLFLDSSLQAYYKAEDLTDSKNSNTLTDHGTVAFNAAKFNNGFDLGTSNSTKYVDIASKLNYTGGAYSIAGWVKITTEPSGAAYGIFAAKEDVTDTAIVAWYDDTAGTKTIQFKFIRIGGIDFTSTVSSGALGTSVFHHIVVINDGAGNIKGYVDNVVSTPQAFSGAGAAASNQCVIGADQNGNQRASAIIDDVGFFNKALSAAEVNILYNDIQLAGAAAGDFKFL